MRNWWREKIFYVHNFWENLCLITGAKIHEVCKLNMDIEMLNP